MKLKTTRIVSVLITLALVGCASPLATAPGGAPPETQPDVLVVNTDYALPDTGAGLADMSAVVVLGTFEKTIGQRPANAVGMGPDGNVDVWQFRIATLFKGKPGAVVHVMRYPDEVAAKQYHMTPGVKAVLFLSGIPSSGLYTTVCGDAGLLLVGKDGKTLKSPGDFVPGVDTIDRVAALF